MYICFTCIIIDRMRRHFVNVLKQKDRFQCRHESRAKANLQLVQLVESRSL